MSDVTVADDLDPTATLDPRRNVVDLRSQAVVQAISPSLDPDATVERAARAIKLARTVGTKPELVVHDVDHYAQQAKDIITADIVGNNKYLRDYIRTNPLGNQLSQDDWHNLDAISSKASQVYASPIAQFLLNAPQDLEERATPDVINRMLVAGSLAIPGGFEKGATEYISGRQEAKIAAGATPHEAIRDVAMDPFAGPAGIMMGGLQAVMESVHGAAYALHDTMYPNDHGGSAAFARHATEIIEWKAQDMAAHGGPKSLNGFRWTEEKANELYERWLTSANTQNFFKTGEMIWFDPALAKIMRKANEQHSEAMHDLYDNIQKSDTFIQDPIHARDLLRTVYKGDIAINAEAISKLYGDKPPTPDDGILGWIPNLAEQLDAARRIGGDVHVPMADYMTNMKEDHFKALADHVKYTPMEITKAEEEAKKAADVASQPPSLPKEEVEPAGPTTDIKTDIKTDIVAEAAPKEEAKQPPNYDAVTPPKWEEFPDFASSRIEEPLIRMRQGAGLEPLASIGDRKLTLIQRPFDPKLDAPARITKDGAQIEPHQFGLFDENGKKVGFAEIVPLTKDNSLFVANIGGLEDHGYSSNSFGPSLSRDLIRQLKQLYPDTKRIGGYRISGARGKTGMHELVWINVEAKGWDSVENTNEFRRVLEGQPGKWKSYSSTMDAYVQPKEGRTISDQDTIRVVEEEAKRTLGDLPVTVQAADRIRATKALGIDHPLEPGGAFIRSTSHWPVILYALEGDSRAATLGTFRHEAMHFMEEYGLIRPGEMEMLKQAAVDRGWIDHFEIRNRYPNADMAIIYKEAIADGYKDWARKKDIADINPHIQSIFERIKDFLEGIRDRIAQLLGKEKEAVTVDDLFEMIRAGEIKGRKINPPDQWLYRGGEKKGGEFVEQVSAGEVIPPSRAMVEGAKEGLKADHPTWAKDYHPSGSGGIVYSRGNIALREGHSGGERYYSGIKNEQQEGGGIIGTGHDIRMESKSTTFTEAEKAELAAAADRLEKANPVIEDMASAPPADKTPDLFKTPGVVGLDAQQARRFDLRMAEEKMHTLATKGQEHAEEIRKDMEAEWKHRRREIQSEVESQIRGQPTTAADLVLARGEYYGQRLAEKPKMAYDDLTPEQRKGLPSSYYTKAGVPSEYTPSDIATLVGFPSGQTMLTHLVEYNKAKLAANMSANDFIKLKTNFETDRIMDNELGQLSEKMQDRINDHLSSLSEQDRLAQETLWLGMKANLEASIDKLSFRNALKDSFNDQLASGIKANYYRNKGEQFEQQVKTQMLGKEWVEAYKSQQGREAWHVLFGEAVKFNKEQKAAEKMFKRLAARNVKGLDIDFQDQIQELMMSAGLRTRRAPEEIATSKQIGGKGTLESFHNDLVGDGWQPDISADILAGNVKDVSTMSVGEWREFRNAVQSLESIGRAVEQINVLGKKESFANFRKEVLANIHSLPMRTRESQDHGLRHAMFGWDAMLTRPEAIMKDLDLGKDMGPLVNMTIRPLAEAKHKEYGMEEKLSADIKALKMSKKWSKSLKEELPNDWFIDPQFDGGTTYFKITRSDLIQIMLNWGNASNKRKFAESWGSSRKGKRATKDEAKQFTDRMDRYIFEHATADDVRFVKGIWDIYKGYRGELETLWRNTSGTQPRMIEPVTFRTQHGDIEGGYYPLKRDRIMSGAPEATIAANQPFGPNYISANTPQGHIKDRTPASYYVDFHGSFTNIPQHMTQVIHDIAFRAEVMQVRQVLKDKNIRNAIRNHYGVEYDKMLDPWLQRTANGATLDQSAVEGMDKFLRNTRMKLTNYALPFNWKVVGTPDLGLVYPILGYWGPGRAEKKDTAHQYSKEIPHAIYNMDRDFREAMQKQVGEGKMDTKKAQITRWGYSVVSYVSREFRTATFTKFYEAARAKGKNEVEAAAIADTYVREHHGSAALHDLPALMSSGEGYRMLTMFYGYWNTMYNWQRATIGDVRRGDYMKAVSDAWGSVIVGTIFGALVANNARQEDTVGDWFIKALPAQLMGTVPGLREVGSYMFDGIASRSALTGAIEAAGGAYNDVKKWQEGKPVEKGVRHAMGLLGLFPGGPGAPGGLQAGQTGQGLYNYAMGRQAPRDIFEWWRLLRTGEAELKHRGQN